MKVYVQIASFLFASVRCEKVAKLLHLSKLDVSIWHLLGINEFILGKLGEVSIEFPLFLHWLQLTPQDLSEKLPT